MNRAIEQTQIWIAEFDFMTVRLFRIVAAAHKGFTFHSLRNSYFLRGRCPGIESTEMASVATASSVHPLVLARVRSTMAAAWRLRKSVATQSRQTVISRDRPDPRGHTFLQV